MEIHFKPELVENYVDHDEWFRQEVKKGLAQLDRGEFVEHNELMSQIEKISCS